MKRVAVDIAEILSDAQPAIERMARELRDAGIDSRTIVTLVTVPDPRPGVWDFSAVQRKEFDENYRDAGYRDLCDAVMLPVADGMLRVVFAVPVDGVITMIPVDVPVGTGEPEINTIGRGSA